MGIRSYSFYKPIIKRQPLLIFLVSLPIYHTCTHAHTPIFELKYVTYTALYSGKAFFKGIENNISLCWGIQCRSLSRSVEGSVPTDPVCVSHLPDRDQRSREMARRTALLKFVVPGSQGLGTDEDSLIEIICSRTNQELQEINRVYKESEWP